MSARPFTSHPGLIDTAEGIAKLAETLQSETIIAFDTEFIRENTFYPVVEIIQVATAKESWLVDAKAFKTQRSGPQKEGTPEYEQIRPLLEIFRNPNILKILHAAQGDQECLCTSFGVVASPSLDTAAAASLCGYGEGVGLGNLLKAVLGVTIKKGHARTDWSVRPLPPHLEEYAHLDVVYLVELGERLLKQLDQLGRRKWAYELSAKWEERKLYEPDPEEMAVKLARGGRLDKRGYAALRELVRWREERVRQLNLPRRWVADDTVLIDLAQVRPKDLGHLSSFRGLNKGELKHSGEAILAAIRKANETTTDVSLPRGPRPDIPSAEESQALDLLKCYLGILADRHQIAARHLLATANLLALLRTEANVPADLVVEGILSEGAASLIGEEVIAMLRGKRALSIDASKIKIVALAETPSVDTPSVS